MGWLALAIVVIGTIYFAIHYRGFRRGLLFSAVGLLLLAAVGATIAWFHSQQEEQRRTVAKTLIKPEQIEISDATLSIGIGSELKAAITNRSSHHLAELALKVTVMDCPQNYFDKFDPVSEVPKGVVGEENPFTKYKQAANAKCNIVGQYVVRQYGIDIPSGQKRAFSGHPYFTNLPHLKPNEWSWNYAIEEIVAKH